MMLPALWILLEEPRDRRLRAKRLDQLDLAVRRIDEADAYALRGQVERRAMRFRAEEGEVELQAPLDRRRRHADMVQATEFHSFTPSC
jgi:hypothetical protein